MAQSRRDTQLNATSASLLGLLAIEDWPRPWTSYELTKQGQRSLHWFWPRAQRQLFYVPKKLVKLGYAEAHDHRTGNRASARYSITESGRAALRAWLADSSPDGVLIEAEELIRVFFAGHGDADQLRTTLHRIGQQAASDRVQLAQVAADMDQRALSDRANINALSIRLISDIHTAVESWADWAIEQTVTWKSIQEPWSGAEQVFADVIAVSNEDVTSDMSDTTASAASRRGQHTKNEAPDL